ncbi:Hypoxia-inducible factor 3-alpha [Larimichthys crocea]|uniref:Hypoxia-inducible factor 3-alpha n=1 Tax=Larimichthys crocea TaxID=215358 RepID=A0A6G0IUD2_LARCR|nr:Hypoxia-inducible factor 3-alpha [Larimichthys crocea]
MDLRFTHCEGRVTELVGYKPDDLIGRSAYEFHHALDSDHVNKSLHTLLSKGQVNTSHYRFLANSGGFVWAETQATVLYSSKTSQPEAVVCLNFILSAVEQPDVVFSVEQIRCGQPKTPHQRSVGLTSMTEQPGELLQLAPEAGDVIVPLTDFVELSFFSGSSPDSVPDHPQDLCTPQLRQLLSPIFNPISPPVSLLSPVSSLDPEPSSPSEEVMDTSEVEKFFAICPQDVQKKGDAKDNMEGMDLEMLAPYISMDDDFQLTFLSGLPEESDKPSSESSAGTSAVPLSRKRTHIPDEELSSHLMIQDKRQKQEASSIEEELLLSHRLLGCLDETDQSDLVLDPRPGGRSRLLTDRDPLLGGIQGLCDTAALMRDISYLAHLTCRHLSRP